MRYNISSLSHIISQGIILSIKNLLVHFLKPQIWSHRILHMWGPKWRYTKSDSALQSLFCSSGCTRTVVQAKVLHRIHSRVCTREFPISIEQCQFKALFRKSLMCTPPSKIHLISHVCALDFCGFQHIFSQPCQFSHCLRIRK